MISSILEKELHQQLGFLPLTQQYQVLDFARALRAAQSRGVEGKILLQFVGAMREDDLMMMTQAIEECEQADLDEW